MRAILKSPWVRYLYQNLEKKNFHTTKHTSLFYEPKDKDGYYKKPEELSEWEKSSLKEKIKLEYNLVKAGVKEFIELKKEQFLQGAEVNIPENHVKLVYRFTDDKKCLDDWIVTTDKENNNGFSTAGLKLTRNSKGLFHGFLDTKLPPDGVIKNTGYCNLRMVPLTTPFKNRATFTWEPYTHLLFRIRGDGRVYSINLHLNYIFDVTSYDSYHFFIWTRGGPYWQNVKIPFSKFFFSYKGRIQCWHQPLPKDNINAISFTIADKITGPFSLEIDYIGIEYDPSHPEETAYETYDFGDHTFW